VAFLLPAERWAAVNRAESVLKERPLYQATSHAALSDGKRSVSVSSPDTNGKRHGQPAAWCVTARKEDDTESVKRYKGRWK